MTFEYHQLHPLKRDLILLERRSKQFRNDGLLKTLAMEPPFPGYVLGTEIAGAGEGQPKLDLKGFRPKTPSRTREFSPGPRVSEMSWNRKVSSLSSGTGKDLANKV